MLHAWPRTEVRPWEVVACGLLVGCGVVCAEAARSVDEDAERRDLPGVWWLPVIVLLPPFYALVAPILVVGWVALRRCRPGAMPWPLEAGLVGLCAYAASAGFDAAVSIPSTGAEGEQLTGAAPLLIGGWGIAVALLCGLLFSLLRIALAAAVDPREELDSETPAVVAAELGAGVSVAVLCALSPPLALVALPPVLLLQQSLLVRRLREAARVDHKTGLLNAGAWQREAEGALEQWLSERAVAEPWRSYALVSDAVIRAPSGSCSIPT
jgi:hypothetical protein